MKHLHWIAAAAVLVASAGSAQALLINLGDGTVQDTATQLIWLQNWNMNGQHDWATQNAWANNLTFAGSSDWELPRIGEALAFVSTHVVYDATSPFTNVQSYLYWSATEFNPGVAAFHFHPYNSVLAADNESLLFFAVAVRPGDVAAVPEPASAALLIAGLASVLALRTARRARP